MEVNPSGNCQILTDMLSDAKNKYIPKKLRNFNKKKDKKEKWMTDELLTQVNKKNGMYVNWKSKSATVEIYNAKKINFKTYEKIVEINIQEAKQKYYNYTFNNYKNNMKKTWKTINETLGKKTKNNKLPTMITHDSKNITDPKEISNTFNSYFATVGSNLASTLDSDNDNLNYQNYLTSPPRQHCTFVKITERDVLEIISKMDNKASSGYDSISNRMIKFIKNDISKSLTLIINQMLKTGIFPNSLKIAKIIPLHKKGNINVISNYRPISLLPTISKIFERVIHNQLYYYFTANNILSEQQYGFRSHHSTELAAIKLMDYITDEIDKKQTPVNIYIDLSKAFDTLNFDILLFKLEYYGVTGMELNLIRDYLSNRKQYVKYNTYDSNQMQITCGVPQGSIVGPLLFSIYLNDLVNVSDKFNYIMYADDTTIYFNLEDFPAINLGMNVSHELSKVNNWLRHNKLSLNADKTKCMVFHTRQKHIEHIQLYINEKPIEHVSSFKFLGIIFDEHLSWKNHITMVTNKLSKVIGILYRLRYVVPEQILLIIYNSLFISHINYGLLLWGKDSSRIFRLQKKAIRIITGSEYLAHTEPLFKHLGILKVHDIYYLKLLKFYYNLSCNLLPSYFNGYLDVIHIEVNHRYMLRPAARPAIQLPRTRLVLSESRVLYQLIELINNTYVQYPKILQKIEENSHTFHGFCYNVTQTYLQAYQYDLS